MGGWTCLKWLRKKDGLKLLELTSQGWAEQTASRPACKEGAPKYFEGFGACGNQEMVKKGLNSFASIADHLHGMSTSLVLYVIELYSYTLKLLMSREG